MNDYTFAKTARPRRASGVKVWATWLRPIRPTRTTRPNFIVLQVLNIHMLDIVYGKIEILTYTTGWMLGSSKVRVENMTVQWKLDEPIL